MNNKKLIGHLPEPERFAKETELKAYEGADRVVTSLEVKEDLDNTDDSVYKIPTGVPTLDRLHDGGFEGGEMVVVSGPTGQGKTTLLMSITRNMVEQEVQALWFTLEVTPRQFIRKITPKDGVPPLFYLPKENTDTQIGWIEERIVEAKVKHDCKVVFLDHLHHIFALTKMEANRNLSWEIGDLAAKLKDMALAHNIVLFVIAHTKDDPSGSSREPRMQDIRDSGLIIRLADSVVGCWRVNNDTNMENTRMPVIQEVDMKSKVRLWKNRREGLLGSWFMFHDKHHLSESDLVGDYDDDNF